ncbi:hypothetical protein [Saccharothrix longispora]|uniref:hypothetical protein n=1 Tax=Saccharothrix longispora TaxID=33920 RepID=UPI0028FCFFF7|nr:hypothetical protein [Saccharothrix longispora]MBY8850803.1 hypothetical protein [Saccharothrix sp. MB29]MDU0293956.1 hypothetical protein [Saccharothrix longispora]
MGLVGLALAFVAAAIRVGVALAPVRNVPARLALFAAHVGLSAWAVAATAAEYGASDDLVLTCAVVGPGALVVFARLGALLVRRNG